MAENNLHNTDVIFNLLSGIHMQRKCYHCDLALLIMQIKNNSVKLVLNAYEITHLQVLGHLLPLKKKADSSSTFEEVY